MRTLHANHLSDLNLKRANNFDIVIDGYDLTLAVKSTNMPTTETEVVEVRYGNEKVRIPGLTSPSGDWSINLRDLLGADVVGTLIAWRRLVHNDATGATGNPKDFKTTGKIYRYDSAGNKVESWTIEGVWPSTFTVGDGDYESGDPVEVTLTLQYDKAYRDDRSTVQPSNINA